MDTSIEQRAAKLISDIRSLQEELAQPATSPTTGMAVAKLSLPAARSLKAVLDSFRIFLWAFIDGWSGRDNVNTKLRNIRMDATCDMLCALYRDFAEAGFPDAPNADRFRLEIGRMAELLAADKHSA